jgi:hypothetical protein
VLIGKVQPTLLDPELIFLNCTKLMMIFVLFANVADVNNTRNFYTLGFFIGIYSVTIFKSF